MNKSEMLGTVVAFLGLVVLWALMSGLFKTLLVIFGILSAALAVWVLRRMENVDGERFRFSLKLAGLPGYTIWLLKEVAISSWAVTRIALQAKPDFSQKLFSIHADQKSDLGAVVFANSITLTPGTITVETEPGYFLVHALNHQESDYDALADMGARVKNLENDNADEGEEA